MVNNEQATERRFGLGTNYVSSAKETNIPEEGTREDVVGVSAEKSHCISSVYGLHHQDSACNFYQFFLNLISSRRSNGSAGSVIAI